MIIAVGLTITARADRDRYTTVCLRFEEKHMRHYIAGCFQPSSGVGWSVGAGDSQEPVVEKRRCEDSLQRVAHAARQRVEQKPR